MNGSVDKKIGKATLWSSVTEVLARLISPIVNMLLARLLAPEAFGLVATITVVITFAEIFTDAGFQKYIIQHEFESEKELDRSTTVAFWTNFVLSALICTFIFLFKDPIAKLVGSPELGNGIAISSLLIIIAAFSSLQTARFRREMDFKLLFYVRLISALMPILVTVPAALVFKDYRALIAGNFACQGVSALILTVKSKWKPTFYYSFSRLHDMLSFSLWTIFESVSIWLTSNIDIFIVGTVLGEYFLGLYKTSMSTINSYMAIIIGALTPVLFSALSRFKNDDVSFKKTYFSFQKLTAVFVLPMGVGIYIFSDLVTLILLGSQWTEAAPFIGLWGISSALMIVFSNYASEVYRSQGNPRLSLISQLIHLCFVIPVIIVSINYGFEVLCVARTAVRLQGVISAFIILRVFYGFKLSKTLINLVPPILCTLIMGCAAYLLKGFFDSVLWQFAVIFISVILYFTTLMLFPSMRKSLKKVIKTKSLTEF